MKYENIVADITNRIAQVTLSRPQALNALNGPLLTELADLLERVEKRDEVDVLILTGAGRAFCAGMDLHALTSLGKEQVANLLVLVGQVIERLRNLKVPVIAAVNGPAITGGLELVLACDIVLAGETAIFGDTHARVGIMPGGGDSQVLPRLVGAVKAKEMLFASRLVSAQEAEWIGLAARVVPSDKLMPEARALAESIRSNDTSIVRRLKRLVNEGLQLDLSDGLMLERREFQSYLKNGLPSDFAERVKALLQRKTADA